MATRCGVKVLLTLYITPFQYLPYSHPVAHSERGSYATCHILWHSTSLEKDPWLLLETRRPCQGIRKEIGLKGLTINRIWHLNSDQLPNSETHTRTRNKRAMLTLIFTPCSPSQCRSVASLTIHATVDSLLFCKAPYTWINTPDSTMQQPTSQIVAGVHSLSFGI